MATDHRCWEETKENKEVGKFVDVVDISSKHTPTLESFALQSGLSAHIQTYKMM